ncbi:MAG: hypothetical protein JNM72_07175 [Deltaproteobacteria bacterium]|nr:hypothetical protein [Deltaproteobacteria bacterium]
MADPLTLSVRAFLESSAFDIAEAATAAELELRSGEVVLTQLHDRASHTVRDVVRAPAVVLARWLAGNWWRLRWEPLRGTQPDADWLLSHELGGAGGGVLWPAVRFASDGAHILVSSRACSPGAGLRYLTVASFSVSGLRFERAIDDFIDQVMRRLSDRGVDDPPLRVLWGDVLAERRDPEAALLRRREAQLGLDPDQVDPADVIALFEQGAWLGAGACEEALVDVGFHGAAARLEQLRRLSVDAAARLPLDLGAFASTQAAWRSAPAAGDAPWARAAQLAARVRADLGLGDGPISTPRLGALLCADLSDPPAPAAPIAVAFGSGERWGFLPRKTRPTSLRFDLARALGDALDRPEGDRALPLTAASTSRQRFQRAFAQELLCPVEVAAARVSEADDVGEAIEDLAADFEVSSWVVRTALVNHGHLDRGALPAAP